MRRVPDFAISIQHPKLRNIADVQKHKADQSSRTVIVAGPKHAIHHMPNTRDQALLPIARGFPFFGFTTSYSYTTLILFVGPTPCHTPISTCYQIFIIPSYDVTISCILSDSFLYIPIIVGKISSLPVWIVRNPASPKGWLKPCK